MQKTLFFVLVAITWLFQSCLGVAMADSQKKVSVLAFNAATAGRYAVLKDGLKNILVNKLAEDEGIVVVESGMTDSESIALQSSSTADKRIFLLNSNLDVLILGTMEFVENSLVFHLDLLSRESKSPTRLSMEAEGDQEIVNRLDELAVRTASLITGEREKIQPQTATGVTSGMDAFRTDHPDKKYKQGVVTGAVIARENSDVKITQGQLSRRQVDMAENIVGFMVENVDQDGTNEIVVLTRSEVIIYSYEKGLLRKLGTHGFDPEYTPHYLSMADLDNDGSKELYVSGMDGRGLSSQVLSWDSRSGFSTLMSGIRYAIRAVTFPGEGEKLLAQQEASFGERFLDRNVSVLAVKQPWQDVEKTGNASLPAGTKLFSFVYANIDGTGSPELVVVDPQMKLAVFDADGELVYRSVEDFAGGMEYIGARWHQDSNNTFKGDDELFQELYYLPSRLVVEDVDGDGRDDIITAQNTLASYKMFSNYRDFSGGKLIAMSWNGTTMDTLWQTEQRSGYVVDFAYLNNSDELGAVEGDVDGGGKPVRVFVVEKFDPGILSGQSREARLSIYDFNIMQ